MTDLPAPIRVEDAASLERMVAHLQRQSAFAIDCEANTLFAYHERLCLLQISSRTRDYVVDPLTGIDLAPLAGVFADPSIMKVLHSAEYDVQLLKGAHPFEFRALFDTKVASLSLGSSSPGLANVLDDWLGVRIDKKYQRSDWGRRPLTEGQLDYARRDTHYLLELAEHVRERLSEAGSPHVEEVAAECRRIEEIAPARRTFDADDFARLKGSSALDPEQRRALRELFVMRDELASQRDVPPFKVLTNDMLLLLAKRRPRSLDKLRQSKILPPKLVERFGVGIIATLNAASRLRPIRRMPAVARAAEDELGAAQRQRYESLRRWRRRAADARSTDPSLILTRDAMLALCRLDPAPADVRELAERTTLEGWRIEHYGEAMLEALGERDG